MVSFYVTITENFECFQYFDFATIFLENQNLFRKTGVPFLVETAETEHAPFLYKTAMSEANVITNIMGSTKWIYERDGTFASDFFIFLKI